MGRLGLFVVRFSVERQSLATGLCVNRCGSAFAGLDYLAQWGLDGAARPCCGRIGTAMASLFSVAPTKTDIRDKVT